jgi:hypothetical protein
VDADCDGVEWCFVDADADGVATEDVAPSAVGDCLGAGEALAGAPRGDCDDADPARFPGGLEQVADGRDNDCDGVERCFVDADGDGWTSPDPLARVDSADADCFDPGESTGALRGDCDDADPGANPGAVEVVGDGVDQDCLPAVYCRVDADGDGFGGAALIEAVDPACPGALPPTADATDCDDARADVWPGAVEVEGDGVDQDCAPGSRCGVDGDGDGALGAVIVLEVPGCAGLAPDGPITDCDDANPARRPGALELAGDGVDADCDGADLCFVDLDGDGWRTDAIVEVDGGCGVGGYVLAGLPPGDCDDGDAAVSPGADEGAGDGVDQNCDGDERCFSDEDEDGWRGEAERVSLDADCEDLGEAGLAMPAGDCDDGDATVFPGADDPPADGVDQACDGGFTCFLDGDGDGWRLEVSVASADEDCDDAGEADGDAPAGDCDDADDRVHPGAAEVAGDGADADCDGGELCFVDVDGDGWRVEDTVWVDGTACVGSGLAADDAGAGDCDDADASVLPGADEAGVFGADVDCDGRMACFVDADEDGWRTEEIVLAPSCSDPGFAVLDDLAPDCDDLDPDRGADCATAPVEEPEGCGCRVEGGGGGAWAWGLPLLWRMRRRGPEKARSNR